jgi:hypothetical protein
MTLLMYTQSYRMDWCTASLKNTQTYRKVWCAALLQQQKTPKIIGVLVGDRPFSLRYLAASFTFSYISMPYFLKNFKFARRI